MFQEEGTAKGEALREKHAHHGQEQQGPVCRQVREAGCQRGVGEQSCVLNPTSPGQAWLAARQTQRSKVTKKDGLKLKLIN